MKIRYHEGIFYPENKEELLPLLGVGIADKSAKAIILPHASLRRIHNLISLGFTYTKGKDRVIILSPLHNSRKEEDKNFFFEGDLLPSSNMFHLGAEIRECYSEEESSAELLIPYIEKYMPDAFWAVLYTDIKSAAESKRLATFLSKFNSPSTLFLVSTNLSPKCNKTEECEMWRDSAKKALEEGGTLLDKANKHQISFCGVGIVDALERFLPSSWRDVADGEKETTAHSLLIKEEKSDYND